MNWLSSTIHKFKNVNAKDSASKSASEEQSFDNLQPIQSVVSKLLSNFGVGKHFSEVSDLASTDLVVKLLMYAAVLSVNVLFRLQINLFIDSF